MIAGFSVSTKNQDWVIGNEEDVWPTSDMFRATFLNWASIKSESVTKWLFLLLDLTTEL